MWSLGSISLVSVLLIGQAYAAALHPRVDDIPTGVKAFLGRDVIHELVEGRSEAKAPASEVPLEAFPEFHTHTLEEVRENPAVLNKTTDPESTAPVSKFAAFSSAAASTACASPGTRVEWRNYPAPNQVAFVNAISCLINNRPSSDPTRFAPSTNRFEDFVVTHQKLTPVVHGNGIFLLWHRAFLNVFEQALREECGFSRALQLPWWDETKDSGKFQQSPLFTNDYFGKLPGPTTTQSGTTGTCVTDGKFANLKCHIGPGQNNVLHCLSRAVNEAYTNQSSTDYVNYCAQQMGATTGQFSSCAETGPHAWAHNGIGSVMADVYSSPSDPVFYMHHLFVDHELASWQQGRNTRKQGVTSACVHSLNSTVPSCTNPVTLNTVLDMNGLRPGANPKVGDILNTQAGILCYKYDYY